MTDLIETAVLAALALYTMRLLNRGRLYDVLFVGTVSLLLWSLFFRL